MGLDFSETTLASETSNGQRETTSFLPPPRRGGETALKGDFAARPNSLLRHSAARKLGRLGSSLGIAKGWTLAVTRAKHSPHHFAFIAHQPFWLFSPDLSHCGFYSAIAWSPSYRCASLYTRPIAVISHFSSTSQESR